MAPRKQSIKSSSVASVDKKKQQASTSTTDQFVSLEQASLQPKSAAETSRSSFEVDNVSLYKSIEQQQSLNGALSTKQSAASFLSFASDPLPLVQPTVFTSVVNNSSVAKRKKSVQEGKSDTKMPLVEMHKKPKIDVVDFCSSFVNDSFTTQVDVPLTPSTAVKPTTTPSTTTTTSVMNVPVKPLYAASHALDISSIPVPPMVTRTITESEMPKAEIDKLQFTFMSKAEIEKWGVVEITFSKLGNNGSVFDLKMGPSSLSNLSEECGTCKQKASVCPGHFGYINFPKGVHVPHPLRYKEIAQFLSLFCHECNSFVARDKLDIDQEIAKHKKGDARFKAILKVRQSRIVSCPNCQSILPTIKVTADFKFEATFKLGKDKNGKEILKKYPIPVEDIHEIFENIPPCDIAILGLDEKVVHPSKFLIDSLLVMPPCARTSCFRTYSKNGSGPAHDDLTINYTEIVKAVNKYNNASSSMSKSTLYETICFRVRTMMDNSKNKAKSNMNKRGLKCIKKRMTTKSGLIRGHIQGKRVDFCARSVITPEANGWVDELVVPEEFAKRLTYSVRVNQYNLELCQRLLNEDKVNVIYRNDKSYNANKVCWTRGFEFRDNDTIERYENGILHRISVYCYKQQYKKYPDIHKGDVVVRYNHRYDNLPIRERKDFALKEGDVIERQLMNGDWTLFNRQPTLWKGSMRAMKVKIMPGKTFRFNMACTQAYNADHDEIITVMNRRTEKVDTS